MSEVGEQYKEEVLQLAKLMLPEMKKVLAKQRREYGIDEEAFPARFPVEQQAAQIDDTPVHTVGMERQCGMIDYGLHKLGTLDSVSRILSFKRVEILDLVRLLPSMVSRQLPWPRERFSLSGLTR